MVYQALCFGKVDHLHPPICIATNMPIRKAAPIDRITSHFVISKVSEACSASSFAAALRRSSITASSWVALYRRGWRSEEHTSELQSLMRISYAVFCLKKKKQK